MSAVKYYILAKNLERHSSVIKSPSIWHSSKAIGREKSLQDCLSRWESGYIDNFVDLHDELENNGISPKKGYLAFKKDNSLKNLKLISYNTIEDVKEILPEKMNHATKVWISTFPDDADIPFERRKVFMCRWEGNVMVNLFLFHRSPPTESTDGDSPFILLWKFFNVKV